MEAAIRWSQSSSQDSQRFLIADVAGNRLQYGRITSTKKNKVEYTTIFQREKLPNFTAFDWSRDDERLVALGTSVGKCKVISIDPERSHSDVQAFPVKLQRKCNSTCFSRDNLLAVGLDRIRGDSSLNIHDLNVESSQSRSEPYRRLTGAEVITNVKFFSDQPNTLIAGSGGVARHGHSLKLFDLRDHGAIAPLAVPTRHIHLLSIDPLDENYFASAGPSGDNALSVWDKRRLSALPVASASGSNANISGLHTNSVLDPLTQAGIWSLRYSASRRGVFAVLSSTGQVRLFETSRMHEGEDIFPLYMRRTYDVRSSGNTSSDADETPSRPIAFDFADSQRFSGRNCILSIRQNRDLEILHIPRGPPKVDLSATSKLAIFASQQPHTLPAQNSSGSIADDLISLQRRIEFGLAPSPGFSVRSSSTSQARLSSSTLRLSKINSQEDDLPRLSSYERHLKVLEPFSHSPLSPEVEETLLLSDVQRRRFKEGFLFDCDQNQKIVKNDAWHVGLWTLIQRLARMAAHSGMTNKGLDFSYFGVHDLWFARFGSHPERLLRRGPPMRKEFSSIVSALLGSQSYPLFEGVETEYPGLRQLGLAICGWKFDEQRLKEKCSEIISRKEYYKAIVVAVCHDRRDMAIELLKSLTRTKVMENSGLVAVIACNTVSEEQRSLCGWMAEEAEDPYLRALLAYFISGTWITITEMAELPLLYRVAVALKYLDDDQLSKFLQQSTKETIAKGDTEGIILTGLAESSVDLFHNYISNFGDLQTAVHALAFTNPRYVKDLRFEIWKQSYFSQMQGWETYIQRVRFNNQHMRMNIGRNGQLPQTSPFQKRKRVGFRCMSCQKFIAVQEREPYDSSDSDTASTATTTFARQKPRGAFNALALGMMCPHCGRPWSRCAICLLPQGSARGAQAAVVSMSREEKMMASFIGYCARCRHGYHPHHAKQWFATHRECPVPGCECPCALLND